MIGSDPDVFVIHSRKDADQLKLYNALSKWGSSVGLRVVKYDDWVWESDNAHPDAFGTVPKLSHNPWLYEPRVNIDPLRAWFKRCEVVVVVESAPERAHSFAVRFELDVLARMEQGPPPAIIVVTSFGDTISAVLREKLGQLSKEFLRVEEPEDVRLKCLVAVPWLVSRLQRSGHTGMEILTEAYRRCPYLHRFIFFGPFWHAAMVDANASHPPFDEWWMAVAQLDDFMVSQAVGIYREAWSVITQLVRMRLRR